MLAVAVEWEIYARTHSATALGLVGLVFAIPIVGLSLPAGDLADRISRKQIILVSLVLTAATSALLRWSRGIIWLFPNLRFCGQPITDWRLPQGYSNGITLTSISRT